MIVKLISTLCQGSINCYILTNMFGKCCGLLGILCPVLAHSAIIFGSAEMKSSGRTKATVKGSFKAFNDSVKPMLKSRPVEDEIDSVEEDKGMVV